VVPDYYYELRRGDAVEATGRVEATGHITREDAFEVGERVVIGGRPCLVCAIYPQLAERAMRIVVQLRPD
jgi:hypothetical protein